MPESRLRNLSIEFAVKILNLVKNLKNPAGDYCFQPDRQSRNQYWYQYSRSSVCTWEVGFHRQIANRFERSQ